VSSLYNALRGAGAQTEVGIGQFNIDLSQTLDGVSLAQLLSVGRDVQASGDWLAVDSGSVGAVRASFHTRLQDDDSVLLHPGKVYRRKFHNLRVFYSPVQAAGAVAGVIPPVLFRAYYGTGPCPFENAPANATGIVLQVPAPTLTVATSSFQFSVTEGAKIDVWVNAAQVTGAAETSKLRAYLTGAGNASFLSLPPDFEQFDDVSVAAASTARIFAKWSGFIVPRGITALSVSVQQLGGNAATNAMTFPGSGIIVR
jgi:hypothetical protein